MEEEFLNYKQAAEYLGVHISHVYQLAKQGRIGREIAGYLVFTRAELAEYKKQREESGQRKRGPAKKTDSPYTVATG